MGHMYFTCRHTYRHHGLGISHDTSDAPHTSCTTFNSSDDGPKSVTTLLNEKSLGQNTNGADATVLVANSDKEKTASTTGTKICTRALNNIRMLKIVCISYARIIQNSKDPSSTGLFQSRLNTQPMGTKNLTSTIIAFEILNDCLLDNHQLIPPCNHPYILRLL